MTNPDDPRSTTGGALGGGPRPEPVQAATVPLKVTPGGAHAGQVVTCRSCERTFTAHPMPGDPAYTLCPHCQSVFRLDALTPAAFDPQSGLTTLADLENPDYARDSQGRPVDVVDGARPVDPLAVASTYADATPHGLSFEATPDGWRLSVPHYSAARLTTALGGIAGPLVMLFMARQLFGDSYFFRSFDLLFLGVILIMAVPAVRNLLGTLMGRTYMEKRGNEGLVREGLWPLQKTRTFSWADVQSVRAVDTTVKEEREDSDDRRYTVDVRHSFLQLLGPSIPVTFAHNVFGANFWELRDFLKAEISRRHGRSA